MRVLCFPRDGEKAYGQGRERELAAQVVSEKRFHGESPSCVWEVLGFFPAFIALSQLDRMAQVNIPGVRANFLPGIKSPETQSYLCLCKKGGQKAVGRAGETRPL